MESYLHRVVQIGLEKEKKKLGRLDEGQGFMSFYESELNTDLFGC